MSRFMARMRANMRESKIEHRANTTPWKKDLKKNWGLYFFILPVIAYYLIFCYYPMYGATIAFRDYSPAKGILGSDWVGLKNFVSFFSYPDVGRLFRNTMIMSIVGLVVGRCASITLALMFHELRWKRFKKITQTISIFPHFISVVVTCTIFMQFCMTDGLFNVILGWFGAEPKNLLGIPGAFVPIRQIMHLWQGMGWNCIIMLAAMSGVDQQIYEAARLDGCGRIQQMRYITLPAISPTRVLTLIMSIGTLLSVGHEDIILLYNPAIYETADVISTYVYRKGLVEFSFSYSTAVGLVNSVLNIILLLLANKIAKTVSETSLL
ncbi:ABC transporter permease subunit [Acetatifactor muris]|uniref:Putative multiple-sugar transport system permease YteP n=1 Tax=Acetatifactor muris TaxID=879566 RepID=A0A2K4ZN92_9FIRM|nr:ABC transporter permease subunit [Acetatifactor muris]MCR2050294.1 ABC transporter permease subunit [Acetatifactor muris]SOY31949.1 putative multiple-sugar transport system permease YteP [Acetatifactor muris]